MIDQRDELLAQANELGLEFPSNIKTAKLEAIIAESQGPAIKADVPKKVSDNPHSQLRAKIKKAKDRAMKLVVVTITNKDNRENDVMTTVSLTIENQYFSIGRNVPLDIPVQIEQCLVDLAENTTMTLHKDEIIDGKRTGNKVAVTVKKFAISYGKLETQV